MNVRDNDKAIGCEGPCEKWFHINCINMLNKDYDFLCPKKDVKWWCKSFLSNENNGITSNIYPGNSFNPNLLLEEYNKLKKEKEILEHGFENMSLQLSNSVCEVHDLQNRLVTVLNDSLKKETVIHSLKEKIIHLELRPQLVVEDFQMVKNRRNTLPAQMKAQSFISKNRFEVLDTNADIVSLKDLNPNLENYPRLSKPGQFQCRNKSGKSKYAERLEKEPFKGKKKHKTRKVIVVGDSCLLIPRKELVENNRKKDKILIVGDSHSRNIAKILRSSFENHVYPGASLEMVVERIEKLAEDFTLNDFVIVFEEGNDVALGKNYNTSIGKALCDLLPLSNQTNIVINTIPVPKNTLLKKHLVVHANLFLHSYINDFINKNVENILINFLNERLLTNHLTTSNHLNVRGKNVVCKRLVELIKYKTNRIEAVNSTSRENGRNCEFVNSKNK